MAAPSNATTAAGDEATELSKQYDTPLGLAHTTMQALKDRIKLHYDLASDYYLNLWCAFHPLLVSLLTLTLTTHPHPHSHLHLSPILR
jgi:hypothetical protein